MKKTFTINLGGIIFHIDEDAYQMLNRYLDSLKHHFSVMDDYQEILDDIELRIAEILQENLSETRQVITAEDINRVIRMKRSSAGYVPALPPIFTPTRYGSVWHLSWYSFCSAQGSFFT